MRIILQKRNWPNLAITTKKGKKKKKNPEIFSGSCSHFRQ